MLSDIFSEEYVRKMREKDAEERGMAIGEDRAYEKILHIMDGIIDGMSDNDIASKYDVDVRRVQKIRADMRR